MAFKKDWIPSLLSVSPTSRSLARRARSVRICCSSSSASVCGDCPAYLATASYAFTLPARPALIIAMFRAVSSVQSSPSDRRSGAHSSSSMSSVSRRFKVSRNTALRLLDFPEAFPPFLPRSLASLLVRTGFRFSLFANHLTFQSGCFWYRKRAARRWPLINICNSFQISQPTDKILRASLILPLFTLFKCGKTIAFIKINKLFLFFALQKYKTTTYFILYLFNFVHCHL